MLSFNDELSVLASTFKGGLGRGGGGSWSVLSPRGHFIIKVLMSPVNQIVGSLPLVHFILSTHVIGQANFVFCILLSSVMRVRHFHINGRGKREATWSLL